MPWRSHPRIVLASLPADDPPPSGARATRGGEVWALPCSRSDDELLAGLIAQEPWAKAAFFDRFAPGVLRVVRRLAGRDRGVDCEDLVHDAFVQALTSIRSVRDGAALRAWMDVVASRTAYRAVRARQARRWLCFWEPDQLDALEVPTVDPDVREAYGRVLRALEALPAQERVPLLLQAVEGWELGRIAEACDTSLATTKRRIARGMSRLEQAALEDDVLRSWLEERRG